MTWFYASSVSVTNGQTVVSVNTGDDVAIAQAGGGLVIGANQPVEIKRTYLDGSNAKKIELSKPWPYATQTNQPAIAFPTDADLAQATKVLQQLIDGFTVASQVEAQDGANNEHVMTPLRTKQAIDAQVGTAARLTATTSQVDVATGRAMRIGDHGFGALVRGRVDVLASQTPSQILATFGSSSSDFQYTGAIQQHGGNAPEGWGVLSGFITQGNNYSYSWQEFTGIYGAKYRRTASGANAWNVWTPVYDGQNAVGSVAFLSGVNTGAIIERGSNANGEYVKFADGTLECWGTPLVIANQLANAGVGTYGWSYYSESNLILFPVEFVSPPAVSVTPQGAFLSAAVVSVSATAFVAIPITSIQINSGAPIMFHAIGRWR